MSAARHAAFLAATDAAQSTVEKGDALTEYIVDIVEQLEGVTCEQAKVFSDDHSQELDAVFWNERHAGAQGLDFFASIFFVEAKNWTKPVGAAEVAWFKEKILQGGHFQEGRAIGLLVAPHGVTGFKREASFAAAIILRAKQEGVHILVVTPQQIAVGASELRDLLKSRLIELAAGRVGFSDEDPHE